MVPRNNNIWSYLLWSPAIVCLCECVRMSWCVGGALLQRVEQHSAAGGTLLQHLAKSVTRPCRHSAAAHLVAVDGALLQCSRWQ